MASEIKNLNPQSVWQYFYDLTQIPRPTDQMEEVCKYVFEKGKEFGLETELDSVGNVIMRKPASPGREDRPIITLQSHLDMVPQKNSDKVHDFAKDPIDAVIDGEWVRADGTTLGADNGIGAAYALAIMSDKTLKHGPLEALFTIDEEVGMVGANALKPGFSKGDILINLDSEAEGKLFVGCAGGIDVNVSLEYKDEQSFGEEDIAVKLSLTGLKGGHSGVDIHIGRANANKLLFRFLKEAVEYHGARLAWVEGGSLRNAIPREAFAIIAINEDDASGLWELVADYQELYQQEYKGIETSIKFEAERVDKPTHLVPEEIQDGMINAVEACVNGPQSMLQDFPGTVESSTNIAVVRMGAGKAEAKFLVRSSSESRKMWVASSIESAFSLAGAKVEFDASYNGWEPNIKSPILQVMAEVFEEYYEEKPDVLVMHAGLECGIIQGAMPDMDMISVGPEIQFPHSPDERVNIESVARTWDVLKIVLERI